MSANEKEISRTDDRRDAKILGTMWVMIATGLSIFLGGFFIWSLDNKYCSILVGGFGAVCPLLHLYGG